MTANGKAIFQGLEAHYSLRNAQISQSLAGVFRCFGAWYGETQTPNFASLEASNNRFKKMHEIAETLKNSSFRA